MKKKNFVLSLLLLSSSIVSGASYSLASSSKGFAEYNSEVRSLNCPEDKSLVAKISADAIIKNPENIKDIANHISVSCPQASNDVAEAIKFSSPSNYDKFVAIIDKNESLRSFQMKSNSFSGIFMPDLVLENPNIVSSN